MEDLRQFYTLLFEANIYNIADVKQDLEKYLDSKNADPVIKQWFMNHYIKHLQKDLPDNDAAFQPHQLQPGDPEWAAKTVDFKAFTEQQEQEILHFIDYFQQLSDLDLSKINKEAYAVIDQKVKDWDKQLASKMDGEVKQNIEGVDYETVMAFPDGYKIVKILGDACRVEEGELMGHCVGGDNYADEDIVIYSLRDPKGYPHVTIEYSDDGIQQIKGKENKAPVARYVPYIRKWVIDNNLEVEQDGENIGMVGWRGEYYFKDSKEFQRKYQNEILPAQRELIQEIESKIVDGVYDGDIDLDGLYFTELPDWSHLTVTGNFFCNNNQLTSLKGCPKIIEDNFYCNNNQLTSLEGCPENVKMYFCCSHNQLTTLEGGPKTVGGVFIADNNNLKSIRHHHIQASPNTKIFIGVIQHPLNLNDLQPLLPYKFYSITIDPETKQILPLDTQNDDDVNSVQITRLPNGDLQIKGIKIPPISVDPTPELMIDSYIQNMENSYFLV